jgi:hypothetical protein
VWLLFGEDNTTLTFHMRGVKKKNIFDLLGFRNTEDDIYFENIHSTFTSTSRDMSESIAKQIGINEVEQPRRSYFDLSESGEKSKAIDSLNFSLDGFLSNLSLSSRRVSIKKIFEVISKDYSVTMKTRDTSYLVHIIELLRDPLLSETDPEIRFWFLALSSTLLLSITPETSLTTIPFFLPIYEILLAFFVDSKSRTTDSHENPSKSLNQSHMMQTQPNQARQDYHKKRRYKNTSLKRNETTDNSNSIFLDSSKQLPLSAQVVSSPSYHHDKSTFGRKRKFTSASLSQSVIDLSRASASALNYPLSDISDSSSSQQSIIAHPPSGVPSSDDLLLHPPVSIAVISTQSLQLWANISQVLQIGLFEISLHDQSHIFTAVDIHHLVLILLNRYVYQLVAMCTVQNSEHGEYTPSPQSTPPEISFSSPQPIHVSNLSVGGFSSVTPLTLQLSCNNALHLLRSKHILDMALLMVGESIDSVIDYSVSVGVYSIPCTLLSSLWLHLGVLEMSCFRNPDNQVSDKEGYLSYRSHDNRLLLGVLVESSCLSASTSSVSSNEPPSRYCAAACCFGTQDSSSDPFSPKTGVQSRVTFL